MIVRVAALRFRLACAAVLLCSFGAFAGEADALRGDAGRSNSASLRTRAEAAEKQGDWETAFGLYCHLYIADRTAPDIREKVNHSLRRVQQLRRHRDRNFQSFTRSLPTSDTLNLYAEVMHKLPLVYVDAERALPQNLWAAGIEELDRALGNPVFVQAYLEPTSFDRVEAFRYALRSDWAIRPVRNAKEARATLRLLLSAAQDQCRFQKEAALVLELVCGACSGLDEYSVYLNPGSATPSALVGDLSEHGIYLVYDNGEWRIDGIAEGSWAAHHTTLRKADRIARVNGHSMDMAGPNALANAFQAPVGMTHVFEVFSADLDLIETVHIPLIAPSVFGARILNSAEGIGYLRVGSLQPSTPRELELAVCELRNRGMRVLVLDFRGNHGGNFLAGVEVAKLFLPAGLIVTTQGQVGEVANRTFSSDSGMNALDVPMVALIDTETASAAEVVVAALKDHNRAVLVGMPTFGKGAMQYPLKLTALDNPRDPAQAGVKSGTVRLTIARLLSPRGTPINGLGVTPDFLEADPEAQDELAEEKALELARQNMARPIRE